MAIVTNNKTIEYWLRCLREENIVKVRKNKIRNKGFTIVSFFYCVPENNKRKPFYIVCTSTYDYNGNIIKSSLCDKRNERSIVNIMFRLHNDDYIITPNDL